MALADYELLARLVRHPGPTYRADVEQAVSALATDHPQAAEALRGFAGLLPGDDPIALEELFTRTFDVQPITSLDIGYTLFGEDYKRGAMLANLSREHAEAGIDCGEELGDHLSNILRLLPRWVNPEVRADFVRYLLGPALREMVREFEPEPMRKKEEIYQKHHKTIIETAEGEMRTAYRFALQAILEVVRTDFGLTDGQSVPGESRFAGSVRAEMGIEEEESVGA